MASLSAPLPRHRILFTAAVVTLLTAGCLGGPADLDVGGDDQVARGDGPVPTTLYLADDWSLSEAVPSGASKRAPLGDFYGAWAQGGPFPEWVSAGNLDPVVVTGTVTLEFWVTTDTAVTSTPGIFPDFVLYFGTSESVMSDFSPRAIAPTADQELSLVTRGDAVQVTAELALPPGGIVIPADAGVRIVTAPVMTETDANDLHILYGSEAHDSQVRFARTALTSTPWQDAEPHSETTSHELLAGSLVLNGEEEEDVTIKTLETTVGPATTGLLVDLVFTGTTPFPDMDLYIQGPDGGAFARSVTPGSDESIHLYGPNLIEGGTGTWTIKVVNYVTPKATFDVTVTHLET